MAGRSRGDGDQIIKRIILESIENCSVCGRQLREDDLKVLGHQKDTWFLMVVCHNCSTQGLISIRVKGEAEDDQSKAYSDLMDKEVAQFAKAEPISVDDVSSMSIFLKSFNGDFVALFEKYH
jgi:hypothetical protein